MFKVALLYFLSERYKRWTFQLYFKIDEICEIIVRWYSIELLLEDWLDQFDLD